MVRAIAELQCSLHAAPAMVAPPSGMDVSPQIDRLIRAFAEFLRHTAPIVAPLSESVRFPGYWNDWVQANWEVLVEAALPLDPRVRLRVYGDGALCTGPGRRILMPHRSETHLVTCRARGDLRPYDLLDDAVVATPCTTMVFDRFVTIDGTRAIEASPFDCVRVLALNARPMIVPIDAIAFQLQPLSLDASRRYRRAFDAPRQSSLGDS